MTKTRRTKATGSSRKGKRTSRQHAAGARAQPRRVVEVPLAVADVQPALDVLRDAGQPVEARLEALQAIQAASFAVPDFDSIRPDYVAALRRAAGDPDPELRQRALGILAREHDGFAQDVLLEGLRQPDKALVPADKALQLLSYDAHAGAYPIAREIVKSSRDDSARREALRLLASDPRSGPVLEEVLADKSEPADIRRMSASALHALNPGRLQRWASRAVLDADEDSDIVATGLSALTQFGDAEAIGGDKQLRRRLNQLQEKAPAKLRQLARRVVKKYEL